MYRLGVKILPLNLLMVWPIVFFGHPLPLATELSSIRYQGLCRSSHYFLTLQYDARLSTTNKIFVLCIFWSSKETYLLTSIVIHTFLLPWF